MRSILLTTVAALAVVACTPAEEPVVVTDGEDVAVVAPAESVDGEIITPAPEVEALDASDAANAVGAAAGVAAVAADADAPLPFLGTWNCADSRVTVTAGTYRAGDAAATRIETIERGVAGYRLVLEDGKSIQISDIAGDTFSLTDETDEAAAEAVTCTKA